MSLYRTYSIKKHQRIFQIDSFFGKILDNIGHYIEAVATTRNPNPISAYHKLCITAKVLLSVSVANVLKSVSVSGACDNETLAWILNRLKIVPSRKHTKFLSSTSERNWKGEWDAQHNEIDACEIECVFSSISDENKRFIEIKCSCYYTFIYSEWIAFDCFVSLRSVQKISNLFVSRAPDMYSLIAIPYNSMHKTFCCSLLKPIHEIANFIISFDTAQKNRLLYTLQTGNRRKKRNKTEQNLYTVKITTTSPVLLQRIKVNVVFTILSIKVFRQHTISFEMDCVLNKLN